VARALPVITLLHGDTHSDPYAWLRQFANPEVRAYLEAEGAWAASQTEHTASLREQLYLEMLGRIQETDATAPYRYKGYWYYTRTEAGRPYPIYCRRRESTDAPEEVYLDQNILAGGKAFHALGAVDVSPDGRWLLYVEDTTARREYILAVKDLESGAIVDRIPDVWTATAWADDNRTFFYTTADAAKRCNAVWRHVVGTDHTADQLVFEETDILFEVGLRRSRSGRYVLIDSDSFTSGEWWCIPAGEPAAAPRVIAPRRPGIEYRVDHGAGGFFVLTNADAPNFRVVLAPEADPAPVNWRDWLPHREESFVEGVDVFRNHVVVSERADGLRRLRVTDLQTGAAHYIVFDEAAYGILPGPNPEFETASYRFTYSSPITPATVYDCDLGTGERALRKRQEVPSGYDPARYEVRRLFAPARDGVRVPVSLLRQRGTRQDGGNPLLLYAYGAYGATTEPTFNSNILSLVDRGFVFAIAHVRGGQELGRRWYDAGKMLRKKNTFHDFLDAAQELIRLGYTRPDRLVASGASAGGLLMGVVANTRPDLFRAIVADVPFVDVINTMLDPSLPLTAQEWQEWGDPRNEVEYRYMLSYSPYDNVAARDYPWMLVTASLNDSQVMYWEPAKWVARLRATKTDHNPLLLWINNAGSHAGSSGRYDRLSETAFRYAFMLDAVGLATPAAPR